MFSFSFIFAKNKNSVKLNKYEEIDGLNKGCEKEGSTRLEEKTLTIKQHDNKLPLIWMATL